MTSFLKQFILETYIRNKDLKLPPKKKLGKRKLTPDMEITDWIHDFVHSKSKRFKDKDKKTRIKMALGAWYSAQHKSKKLQEMIEEMRIIL